MPLGIGLSLGSVSVTDHVASSSAPTYWLDSAYDSRVQVDATNAHTGTVWDHLVTATVPDGIDSDSVRVVEISPQGGLWIPWATRYNTASVNRLRELPHSLSGTELTIKALGRWDAGESRSFHVYWNSGGGVAAPSNNHLDVVAQSWSVAITAGTTGDSYTLVVNGTAYTHIMTVGQTAANIATALRALINAGSIATAGGSSATVTVTARSPYHQSATFAVVNTGSTVPGNVVVTSPAVFTMSRIGPDTDQISLSNVVDNFPLRASGLHAQAAGRLALGVNTFGEMIRLLSYKVSGDAGTYGLTVGEITSIAVKPDKIIITATVTGSVRSGQPSPDWAGVVTATFQDRVAQLNKSSGVASSSQLKNITVLRVQMTLTAQQAYTPFLHSSGDSSTATHILLSLNNQNASFSGGVTAVGEQLTKWYAGPAASAPATLSASADTVGMSLAGSIVGTGGNTNCYGLMLNSASISLGAGQAAAHLNWWDTTLQIPGTTNAATIPAGSTIDLDFWTAHNHTTETTANAANATASEIFAVLRSLSVAPTVAVGDPETYAAGSAAATLAAAATRAVEGCQWFADTALTYTGDAGNTAFQYVAPSGDYASTVSGDGIPDDDDGNYGEAHKLHGFCIRYLRTHDASLIAQIERQVQYHLDMEADAITLHGAWYSGSAPYWRWVSPTPSSARSDNGGAIGSDGSVGTIVYNQGDVRRATSIDQIHMVAHGLYAYRYLLRNEPAITANATLWANAKSYIDRMAAFENAHVAEGARLVPNMKARIDGTTPPDVAGLTDASIADPYYGDFYGLWQISNTDGTTINPSSNSAIDVFFRALFADNSTLAAVTRFLQGRCMDMLTSDAGRHDVTFGTASWGVMGTYPDSWLFRAGATGNSMKYTSGRAGDDHYLHLTAGGVRDHQTGRAAQRLVVLCLAALFDPTFVIPVETDGAGTVVRSVNVVTAATDLALSIAMNQTEPTTKSQSFSAPGFLGAASPTIVDSAFTGYWMMAIELWHLVNSGASYIDYYPLAAW